MNNSSLRDIEEVIAEGSSDLGGHQAISCLPEDYRGPCLLEGDDSTFAVLPNRQQAYRVAVYAITHDGGYCSVYVKPSDGPVTHSTLEEWIARF